MTFPMSNWTQDIRFALRCFAKNPWFAVVAVLSLGIGIGANTSIFSVANALLLRPLPFDNPDRLVILWNRSPGLGEPERVGVIRVSSNLLQMLGVRPVLGRLLTPNEDLPGYPSTALLTDGMWARRFGR